MHAFKRWMLGTADKAGVATQIALCTFGFVADGRELVTEEVTGGGLAARFPDRTDDGWPEVILRLPSDARFLGALSSVLSRGAMWLSESGVDEVAGAMRDGLAGHPVVARTRRSGSTALRVESLRLEVTIFPRRVVAPGEARPGSPAKPRTGIVVGQTRTPEDVRRAMEARSASLSEAGGP